MIALTSSPNPATSSRFRPWKSAEQRHSLAGMIRRRIPVPYPEPGMTSSLFESMRTLDLFSQLPDGDLLKLAALARDRRFDKGDFILRPETSNGEHLFILLEGTATATWEGNERPEGTLATLKAGDLIGELDLFDPIPSTSASVRATSSGRLLSLRREDLLRGLRERPELALGFLGAMAHHLRLMHRRISGISQRGAARRLACALITLLEERGVRLKDASGRLCLLLRDRPTQRVIADLAGMQRETASRLLAVWCREGWMQDSDGDLMVIEEARLRGLAGE